MKTIKVCRDYGLEKGLDQFSPRAKSPDARATYCHNKRCRETRERLYVGGRGHVYMHDREISFDGYVHARKRTIAG